MKIITKQELLNEFNGGKMSEETKGKQPDYKGNIEVACWKKTDKNGNTYLSCTQKNFFALFKNNPKPKKGEDI